MKERIAQKLFKIWQLWYYVKVTLLKGERLFEIKPLLEKKTLHQN